MLVDQHYKASSALKYEARAKVASFEIFSKVQRTSLPNPRDTSLINGYYGQNNSRGHPWRGWTNPSFISKSCLFRESMCVTSVQDNKSLSTHFSECLRMCTFLPDPFDLLVQLKWIHNTLVLIKLQICGIESLSL